VEEPDTGAEEFLTEDFAIGPTAGVVDGDMAVLPAGLEVILVAGGPAGDPMAGDG
jgi:hypothetical protein